MAIPTFTPIRNPTFPISRRNKYPADVQKSQKGYEVSRPLGIRRTPPLQLTWDAIKKPELDDILSFFDSLHGSLGPFRYRPFCSITGPEGAILELGETPGGSLTSQPEYFVRITWYEISSGQETTGSREYTFTVSNNNLLTVKVPVFPLGVFAWRVYIGTVTGDAELQAGTEATRVWTMPTGGRVSGGANPPAENNLQPLRIFTFNGELPDRLIAPGLYTLEATLNEQSAVPEGL